MRAVVSRRLGLAIAAAAIVGLSGTTILPRPSAAAEPAVTVVVKIAGIPWFNALSKGVEHGGKDFALDATMIGPANVDPAQQVKLVEDLIAKKVAVIGPSSNQTIFGFVPVCEMVSGTWLVSDEPAWNSTIPPRGTRLTSHGAAFCALVALIVYPIEIQPDVASTE